MLPDSLLMMDHTEGLGYTSLLAAVAVADGRFTDEEMSGYESRTASLLLTPMVRERLNDMLESDFDVFGFLRELSPDSRKLALRDCVLMAAADGEYDPAEIKLLESICTCVDVSKETLEELYEWVREGWQWQRRGHAILGLTLPAPTNQAEVAPEA